MIVQSASPAHPAVPTPPAIAAVADQDGVHGAPIAGTRAALREEAQRKEQAKIAIVDDEPLNIQVVQKYLHDAGYRYAIATSDSHQAVELILRESPDLVFLDILMPGVNGLEILHTLRSAPATKHLPVLILTMVTDPKIKRQAIELGATDFLHKPVDPHDLIPRVRNALQTKAYHDQLVREHERLEDEVRRRTAALAKSREEVVHCLARTAEYRDDDTGEHVARVGRYVGIIARELGFNAAQVELLELASQLHDLGKIAIPDSILQYRGKLTPAQFAEMRKHCGYAKKIMQPVTLEARMPFRLRTGAGADLTQVRHSPLLTLAARIAQTHHERWDGTGYPLGLAGDDIPIEGRMTAVADVYDALSSRRPYKEPFPQEKCFALLEAGRGTHFDARVLDAFLVRKADVQHIQRQSSEPE